MAGSVMPWMLSRRTLRCRLAPPFPKPLPPLPRQDISIQAGISEEKERLRLLYAGINKFRWGKLVKKSHSNPKFHFSQIYNKPKVCKNQKKKTDKGKQNGIEMKKTTNLNLKLFNDLKSHLEKRHSLRDWLQEKDLRLVLTSMP